MPTLQTIEMRVLQALPGLSLRPTLERAAEVGGLLATAREMCPHGEWVRWLRRVRLSRTTAFEYISVHRHLDAVDPDVRHAEHISIRRFLDAIRRAKYAEREDERRVARVTAAGERGRLGDGVRLTHGDARCRSWPQGADAYWTDPPWSEEALPLYDWLAATAAATLKPGGIVGVQCGTNFVAEVIRRVEKAGLRYIWLLTFNFSQSHYAIASQGCFRATVRPVLLFSQGEFRRPASTLTDAFVCKPADQSKPLHPWQQPLSPHLYFLSALLSLGALVCDPFAGSGTTGEAALRAGLRFEGCEEDEENYKVARGRLARVRRELLAGTPSEVVPVGS